MEDRTIVAHGCRKTKKPICGMEGKNVVPCGRLAFPRSAAQFTVLGRNLFSIANDCTVNPSDLSKMLVKKQIKYFDVPLEHEWKVPVLQELLNTRMNNLCLKDSMIT